MRDVVRSYGNVAMTLVVKQVKGKLYVYEQYRLPNGYVATRYIAPLEKLVREYQARLVVNSGTKVNYTLRPRQIRRLAQLIAEDVVNLLQKNQNNEKVWWTGRDLNPGPLGCKPSALPG